MVVLCFTWSYFSCFVLWMNPRSKMFCQIIILQKSWWLNDINDFLFSFICLKDETLSVLKMKNVKLKSKHKYLAMNEPLIRCFRFFKSTVIQIYFENYCDQEEQILFHLIISVFENCILGIVYFSILSSSYEIFFNGCFLNVSKKVTGNINLPDCLLIRLRF